MPSLGHIFALVVTTLSLAAANFVSYQPPSFYSASTDFSVTVNGTKVYSWAYKQYDYVQLSMDEGYETEFVVTANTATSITSHSISPLQLPITATTSANNLTFSMKDAHYLIVKINSLRPLIIVVDETETNVPNPSASNVFNIRNYGAISSSTTITTGVQKALDAANGTSGAIVYVPPGMYTVGNIKIPSQVSLYLAGGSVLFFTGIAADYDLNFYKSSLSANGTWWIQTDVGSSNIKIYGRGNLDANGYNSRHQYSTPLLANTLVPVGTTNFQCDGITIRNGAFWTVTPVQVTGATFTNLKIFNRLVSSMAENDCIDVIESTGVTVSNVIGFSWDDAFSTKTWPADVGVSVPYPYTPRPLSNVVFDNCVASSQCFAYKIGQGAYEAHDGVTFQNSVVYSASVAMGMDHAYGTAAVTNVTFNNIDVEALGGTNDDRSTWMELIIEDEGKGVGPASDFTFTNLRIRTEGPNPVYIHGYNSTVVIDSVKFTDVYMLANTTAATTFAQLNIQNTTYASNVNITNS